MANQPKDARTMTDAEYAAAKAELLREARKTAESDDKARAQAALAAKYNPKEPKK